jgi:hypothetical protein
MPFDPNAAFEVVPGADSAGTGGFDPSADFQVVPSSRPRITVSYQDKQERVPADEATLKNYVAAPFSGFNRGLGMPIDAMTGLLNLGVKGVNALGGEEGKPLVNEIKEPFLGSEWFAKHFNTVRTPDTPAGRVLERAGEEFGAAVAPSAGIMKAASAMKLGAQQATSFVERFLQPIANSPGKALLGEATATGGSGVGAGVAREVAPDSPGAEMTGQILGGFSPAAISVLPKTITGRVIVGTGKVAGEAAATLATPFRKDPPKTFKDRVINSIADIGADRQRKKGFEAVRDLLGNEMTPQAEASMRAAGDLSAEIPGFKPSIAEATGSPALIAQQTNLEKRASGKNLDWIVNRHRDNTRAVDDFAASSAPDGAENPEFVVNAAKGRVDSLRNATDTQAATVQTARQELARRAFPVVDRAEAGGTLRTELQAERAARREEADALSQQLGLDNIDVSVPFTDWSQRVHGTFAARSAFEDAENTPRILRDIERVGQPVPTGRVINGEPETVPARVTFRDLKALRERISDDLIDSAGSANPSRRQVRILGQLRGEVDNLIEHSAHVSDDPQFAERYAQFRRAYFDNYIRPFEQGAAYKVRAMDGRGFYKTTDEKVADAFFKSGDTSAADQFNELFANRPEARAALRSTAIDNLREFAVRDGVIDPRRFADWLRQHRSVLERFPDLRDELRTPAMADAAYIRRQSQLAERRQTIEDAMLTKAVRGYDNGNTADAVIDGAIREPRRMAQLVGAARRVDGALPALRRNVWDKAVKGDAQGILDFMKENRASLGKVFDPEHLGNIRKIALARSMLQRVPDPAGAAYVPRPLEAVEKTLGQGIPQLLGRAHTLITGRAQKEWLIAETVLRSMRGRAAIAMDDALRAALYDPKVAKELSNTLEIGSMTVLKAKRLQSRLIALGIPLLNQEKEAPEQ